MYKHLLMLQLITISKRARKLAGEQVPLVSGWFDSIPRAPYFLRLLNYEFIDSLAKLVSKPFSNHSPMTPIRLRKWRYFEAQKDWLISTTERLKPFPSFDWVQQSKLSIKKSRRTRNIYKAIKANRKKAAGYPLVRAA